MRRACGHRWVPSVTVSTTPCARAFSPPSNANCSTAVISRLRSRRAWRSSNLSKGGTTRIAAIRRSTICLPLTSREPIGKTLVTAAPHRPPKRGNSRRMAGEGAQPRAVLVDDGVFVFGECVVQQIGQARQQLGLAPQILEFL